MLFRIRLATKWHWAGFSFWKLLLICQRENPSSNNERLFIIGNCPDQDRYQYWITSHHVSGSKNPLKSEWLAVELTQSIVTWKSDWFVPSLYKYFCRFWQIHLLMWTIFFLQFWQHIQQFGRIHFFIFMHKFRKASDRQLHRLGALLLWIFKICTNVFCG